MINIMTRNILIVVLSLLILGCSRHTEQKDRVEVARAGDRTLYFDQIPDIFQPEMSKADSISALQSYVRRWARKELLSIKAEQNLTTDYKAEVERQLDEMYNNLLIYQYQQQMIIQKMDTTVSENEMEEYYLSNMNTFGLTSNIIKVLFIKIPVTAPQIEKARMLYKSSNPADFKLLKDYCYQFASQFDDFGEKWIAFNRILLMVPLENVNQETWLPSHTYVELKDDNFYYFINIRDYKLRGTIAPYEYITDQVKTIILNNRRNDFLQKLEDGIYDEAIRDNTLKVY
jgi:hypothetical protein